MSLTRLPNGGFDFTLSSEDYLTLDAAQVAQCWSLPLDKVPLSLREILAAILAIDPPGISSVAHHFGIRAEEERGRIACNASYCRQARAGVVVDTIFDVGHNQKLVPSFSWFVREMRVFADPLVDEYPTFRTLMTLLNAFDPSVQPSLMKTEDKTIPSEPEPQPPAETVFDVGKSVLASTQLKNVDATERKRFADMLARIHQSISLDLFDALHAAVGISDRYTKLGSRSICPGKAFVDYVFDHARRLWDVYALYQAVMRSDGIGMEYVAIGLRKMMWG